jgi:hypothetical protein
MVMVHSFFRDAGPAFDVYVKQTADVMIPLLDHSHERVRETAVQCMPLLLKSATGAHKQGKASTEFVKA